MSTLCWKTFHFSALHVSSPNYNLSLPRPPTPLQILLPLAVRLLYHSRPRVPCASLSRSALESCVFSSFTLLLLLSKAQVKSLVFPDKSSLIQPTLNSYWTYRLSLTIRHVILLCIALQLITASLCYSGVPNCFWVTLSVITMFYVL